MLISTTTGFENFESGSAKSYVFVAPSQATRIQRELHLGVAARSGADGISAVGAPQSIPAAPGFIEETGRWTTATYEVPEHTILKLFAQRNGGFGSMRIMASLFVRMRKEAAVRKIGTVLTAHPKATYSRVWLEGRFDILTLEQAMALGVVVPPSFAHTYAQTMVNRAFEFVEVSRELSAPAQQVVSTVQNSAGETVEIRNNRKARALDL